MSLQSEFTRMLNNWLATAKKITQLTALPSPVTTGDLFEVVRAGQNYKADGSQLPSGGGGGTWGSITGTLSSQTDLQTALDLKESLYRTFDRKTGNYPLVLADASEGIEMNVAGANTVTVPLNATQAFPVGTLIPVVQYGAGLTSIVATGGVTINTSAGNLDSPGQYAPMFLRKIATDEWYLWNGTAGGGAGTVTSVTGTTNRIAITGTATDPIVNIDAAYDSAITAAIAAAVPVKADQNETDVGDNDAKFITPVKLLGHGRKTVTVTGNTTIDQEDHDQAFVIADSASAIAFDFPSLEAGTIVTIININAGDVTWTNSGGTSFVGGITSMPGSTLMAVTFRYRSTTVIEILGGMASTVETLAVTNSLSLKAGLSAGTITKVGGIIHNAFAPVGNVTTGEDTLLSFPLAANVLSTDGMSARLTAYITFAATATNKTLKVKFGGTTGYDSTALAINNAAAFVRVVMDITRTGAATQMLDITITPDNSIIGTLVSREIHTTAAETLSGAVNIIITGEATNTNDIVKSSSQVLFFPTA